LLSKKGSSANKVELFVEFSKLSKLGIFSDVAHISLSPPTPSSSQLLPVFTRFSESVSNLIKTMEKLKECDDELLSVYMSGKLPSLKGVLFLYMQSYIILDNSFFFPPKGTVIPKNVEKKKVFEEIKINFLPNPFAENNVVINGNKLSGIGYGFTMFLDTEISEGIYRMFVLLRFFSIYFLFLVNI
jgi:hypothetical protein